MFPYSSCYCRSGVDTSFGWKFLVFLYGMGSKSMRGGMSTRPCMGAPVEHDASGFLSPGLERVPFRSDPGVLYKLRFLYIFSSLSI